VTDNLFEGEAVLVAARDQLLADLFEHVRPLGLPDLHFPAADECPGPLLRVEDPQYLKFRVSLSDCVRVHLEPDRKLADRGQLLPRQQPLGGNPVLDLVNDLPMEGHPALDIQSELNHQSSPSRLVLDYTYSNIVYYKYSTIARCVNENIDFFGLVQSWVTIGVC